MSRSDRLFILLQTLRDGAVHRAEDLARQTGVSVRTTYRDMESLAASGVALSGTRGTGYRLADVTPLPPLSLTGGELAALMLGIAIVEEATDPDLKAAARSLADKIDAALPAEGIAPQEAWKFATSPFASPARGMSHIPTLRAAIGGRQKLRLTYTGTDGTVSTRTVRPLRLDYHGRVWTLATWCEQADGFRSFRLDLIDSVEALPELFVDEPGKRLEDMGG